MTDQPVTLDQLVPLISERRGISRRQARELLAIMPGGGELLTGAVSPENSPVVIELLAEDPG